MDNVSVSKRGDCGSALSIDSLEGGITTYPSMPEQKKNDQRLSLKIVKFSSYKRNHNGGIKSPFQNQTHFVPKLLERSCSRGNFKSINFHSAISKNIEKNGYEFYKNTNMQNRRSKSLVQRTPSPDPTKIFEIACDTDTQSNKPLMQTIYHNKRDMCTLGDKMSAIPASIVSVKDKKRKSTDEVDNEFIEMSPCTKRLSVETGNLEHLSLSPNYTSNTSDLTPSVVRVIPPSRKGIHEASRIIRSRGGVVSIPTEKDYTMLCFTPFRKLSQSQDRNDPLDAMLAMKPFKNRNESLYLYHPIQAYKFVSFSNRKTFIFNPNGSQSSPLKITISESHEVLNRLSSAFWPGTITIFAPVRSRSHTISRDDSLNPSEEGRQSRVDGQGSMSSFASLNSLTSEDNDTSGDASEMETREVPVLPDSILRSGHELFILEDGPQQDFIAMRCPSHPLARKILSETYAESEKHIGRPLKGAIIGTDVCSTQKTCKDVCKTMSSLKQEFKNNDHTVHVVNGDDRLELFSVPPCQFSDLPSVSLIIDAPHREVILMRSVDKMSTNSNQRSEGNDDFDVSVRNVSRALLHSNSDSIKARAIAAVMAKWNVREVVV